MIKTFIAKEEILAYHALASLRKPEITNNLESLVLYFKEVFKVDVTVKEIQFVLEPTLEEEQEDLKLIYNKL